MSGEVSIAKVLNCERYSAQLCSGCRGLAAVPASDLIHPYSVLSTVPSAWGQTPSQGQAEPSGHLLWHGPLAGSQGEQSGGTVSLGHIPELQISSMSMSE